MSSSKGAAEDDLQTLWLTETHSHSSYIEVNYLDIFWITLDNNHSYSQLSCVAACANFK